MIEHRKQDASFTKELNNVRTNIFLIVFHMIFSKMVIHWYPVIDWSDYPTNRTFVLPLAGIDHTPSVDEIEKL